MKTILILTATLLLFSLHAFAGPGKGEKLFNSTKLGSNGKSCQTCHPDGKGLEDAKNFDSEMLRGFINICIEDALNGKPLKDNATELKLIESYVLHITSE